MTHLIVKSRLVLAVAVLTMIAPPASDEPQESAAKQETEQLAVRAREITDIRTPGSPSFRLRAGVRIEGMSGGPHDGAYLLLWASPDQWREEVAFEGFQETRLAVQDKIWVKRNLDFTPVRVEQIRRSMNFVQWIKPAEAANTKPSKLRKKEPNLECFELGRGAHEQICFELNTGRPAKLPLMWTQGGSFLELSDYTTLGSKVFPRRIAYFDEGQRVVEITVEELSDLPPDSNLAFNSPEGAEAWPWCPDMEQAKVPNELYAKMIPSSVSGQRRNFYWHITMFAVVSADGQPSDVRVIQNNQPALQGHFLGLMKGALFQPARCGGNPVRSEAVLEYGIHQTIQ